MRKWYVSKPDTNGLRRVTSPQGVHLGSVSRASDGRRWLAVSGGRVLGNRFPTMREAAAECWIEAS